MTIMTTTITVTIIDGATEACALRDGASWGRGAAGVRQVVSQAMRHSVRHDVRLATKPSGS
ncbi:hypothetical protein SAMN05216359_101341 [Roseateles sp. YR242]|nr:hypothetical protein SAMN05216359_101341 [Roseateles sp. YR242]